MGVRTTISEEAMRSILREGGRGGEGERDDLPGTRQLLHDVKDTRVPIHDHRLVLHDVELNLAWGGRGGREGGRR